MKWAKGNAEGWFITLEGRLLILEKTAPGLVRLAHDITHLGKSSLPPWIGLINHHYTQYPSH
jgi:hypothetical protein